MAQGAVVATFLIVFREALEASLIVAIILTALAKLNQHRYFTHVIVSSLLAILASVGTAGMLLGLTEAAQGRMSKILEGSISILASAVLTYMTFWMRAQARKIKSDIETSVEQAVTKGELLTIVSLPFLAVFREGSETILFLKAVAINNSTAVSLWGCLGGLALALAVIILIFMGGRKLSLKLLFRWSSLFLLLIAAGLLAYGVHEFEELGILPGLYAPVWDINPILNEKAGLGSFLKALFGYNGNPSLLEVMVYGLYLATVLYYLREKKPQPIQRL